MFEKGHRKWIVFIVLAGVLIGFILLLGVQKTLEYTDSPKFCSSCHVMDTTTAMMKASSHANLSCNDCHLPHDNIANKLIHKVKYGTRDMYANTIGRKDIPDVIHTSKEAVGIINTNCIECHENTVSSVSHDAKDNCMDCHRGLPHGKQGFKTKDFYEVNEYKNVNE